MKKISVIVPAYNCAKYIKRCVTSVLNQSYRNIEVVVINDGSSDDTLKNLNEFNDERLKVITISNSGVSHARNLGIKNATGEMIMFLDADDYLDKEYLKSLEKYMNNNIIITGATFINEKNEILSKDLYISESKLLKFSEIKLDILNTIYFSHSWGILINLEFLKNKKIKFDEKLKYGEDFLFNYELFKNEKIYYASNVEYFYYQNSNSYTHQTNLESLTKQIDDSISVYLKLLPDYDKNVIYNRILSKLNIHFKKLFYKNSNLKYSKQKRFILENIGKIDLHNVTWNVSYLSKIDKLRYGLLKLRKIHLYIILNRVIRMIRG